MRVGSLVAGLLWLASCQAVEAKSRPNIVFIFTDDQDLRQGSFDSQTAVQELLAAEGTVFTNHYATVAVCCPSRVSLMRGQHAHNTNNTDIKAPGGGYPKFKAAGLDDDYLPHWLGRAGYNAESDIGKLFNGDSLIAYNPAPKGWRHIDVLLDPYTNAHNTVVMSENGARPVYYEGFQQTDVVRIKALDRLRTLLAEEDPFFLMIAPTAPHCHDLKDAPIPPARYMGAFANTTVPRAENFNPADKYQEGKPSWLGKLPALNESQIKEIDHIYQRRLEALRGVDDIIEDVVEMLEKEGALENTYIIYSSDQGYHLGTHRHGAGKCTHYLEDTNIPLVVRGPGIPRGAVSNNPSIVADFAPTLLEIAGLPSEEQPPFFDGSSLLKSWQQPDSPASTGKEAINIEFWGAAFTEMHEWADGDYAPYFPGLYLNNTYKTMRLVGDNHSWMYSRWCTNQTELYDTLNDPYELLNLADSTDPYHVRVISRLNALLLVAKSCTRSSCRNPWRLISPPSLPRSKRIRGLADALDPNFDDFYNSFPTVQIEECVPYQYTPNEGPYFPESAEFGLGMEYRKPTDNFAFVDPNPMVKLSSNQPPGGGWEHRHASIEMLLANARVLTDDELAQKPSNSTLKIPSL
ncbi:hypothetical protein EsH8_IV_000001 [Colletotrichum jinshuiense]